jgi:hypothetical protein
MATNIFRKIRKKDSTGKSEARPTGKSTELRCDAMNELYSVKQCRLSLASGRGAAFFTPRRRGGTHVEASALSP